MARHYEKSELLQAMFETLRKLDEFKLVHPDELEIVDLRQILLNKITEIMLEDFTNGPMAA